MAHPLLEQYPEGVAPIKQFGDDHPEILSLRRSRACIDRLQNLPELAQRVFRKRFGRWYVHIPSLIAYMEDEDSIIAA